jgi:hypothetical protein
VPGVRFARRLTREPSDGAPTIMRRPRTSRRGVTLVLAAAAILVVGVSAPAHAQELTNPGFRLVVLGSSGEGDADADGVPDASDVCADTTFTAGPVHLKPNQNQDKAKPDQSQAKPKAEKNQAKLKPNRYWSPSDAGFVDRTGAIRYTLEEAGGCSAEQVTAAAGLGKGHLKHGISRGAMKEWVASLQK